MAEVTLKNLSKNFGTDIGVEDISMTIPDGAFVVLLGPTGAGKTTTLRLISGLEQADRGEIWVDGRNVGHEHLPSEIWQWSSSNTRFIRTSR